MKLLNKFFNHFLLDTKLISTKDSDFVFGSIDGMYYKCNKSKL